MREVVPSREQQEKAAGVADDDLREEHQAIGDEPLRPFEKLWNYTDPAASESSFRAHLVASDLSDADRAELLTQISRACCLQRHHDEARAALDEARPLLADGASRPRVRWLLELGRLCNELDTERNGVPYFEEAWRLANACGEDFHAVDAAHMLGYVLDGRDAVDWHERGLERVRATRDERAKRWHFRLLANLVRKYVDLGRHDDALRCGQEALAVCDEQQLPAEKRRDARWHFAFVHRHAGDAARALEIQRELEAEVAADEERPDGYVFEEIAECLLALGRAPEATPYFAKAYEQHRNDPWFPPTEAGRQRLARIRERGERADADDEDTT